MVVLEETVVQDNNSLCRRDTGNCTANTAVLDNNNEQRTQCYANDEQQGGASQRAWQCIGCQYPASLCRLCAGESGDLAPEGWDVGRKRCPCCPRVNAAQSEGIGARGKGEATAAPPPKAAADTTEAGAPRPLKK